MLQHEYEWFDFKENWFSKIEIGEYISAISNSAALCGKEEGFILWGIKDKTLEIVGTDINLNIDIEGEPFKHYLARNLKPSVAFEVAEINYNNKRLVLMTIPAAKSVPTSFNKEKYIRIGSSKEKLNRFPEWEVKLNNILVNGLPSVVNTEAPFYAQELTFLQLQMYYAAKGIGFNIETFEKTLKFKNKNGKFNVLAYILSDQNTISIRVSVFSGAKKSDPLYSVKEFGNKCILYSMDRIFEYGDTINIIQADERGRISQRKDVPLFDYESFHEAVLNAFIHNKWVLLNGPAVSIFTDRIEILSHGGLPIDQDLDGFYKGASLPVNQELSDICLQLRLSERSGRGVPKIISKYGKEAFEIEKNRITVTIPFNKINVVPFDIVHQEVHQEVHQRLKGSKLIIVETLRDNPNTTIPQLVIKTGITIDGVKKNLKELKKAGFIERIGSNNGGYWKVIK